MSGRWASRNRGPLLSLPPLRRRWVNAWVTSEHRAYSSHLSGHRRVRQQKHQKHFCGSDYSGKVGGIFIYFWICLTEKKTLRALLRWQKELRSWNDTPGPCAVIHIPGRNRGEGGRCAVQVPNRRGDREEGGCRRAKRSETIKAIGDAAANMF